MRAARSILLVLVPVLVLLGFPSVAAAHNTPPCGLVVTARTDISVSLDWSQCPYEHSYSGYYVRTNGGARVLYGSSAGTVTGLLPGTSYRFCVTINFTSSDHPDESDPACLSASTTGTVPSTEPDYESALWRPYAVSSPFNKPVGPNPVPSPNGAEIVRRVLSFSSTSNGPGAIELDNPDGETSHARYHATSSDPVVTVDVINSWCTGDGHRIHVPLGATPAGDWNNPFNWSGWDGHMSVTQPRNAITGQILEYDFYQGRSLSDGILRADCGGFEDVEQGDGLTNYSTTVANFANMAGQLKASELLAYPTTPIDHALFMTVPCSNGTHVSWLTTSGNGAACADRTNAPPLGQRFTITYTDAEIAALPAYARPWVRAIRDYGMYFGDTGGPADFGLHAALEASYTYASFGRMNPINTWAANMGLPRNSAGRYVLRLSTSSSGIDWTRLKAIEP